jgi:hypothetical protein
MDIDCGFAFFATARKKKVEPIIYKKENIP